MDNLDLKRNWTPAMYASAYNRPRALRFLIEECGADVHAIREGGVTCVYLASIAGAADALHILVANGCSTDVDCGDATPLEWLCSEGHAAAMTAARLQCAQILILSGAHVTSGYVGATARAPMLAWARERMRSQYAPVCFALCVDKGNFAGVGCAATGFDGRVKARIASFLMAPRKHSRRVARAAWVWSVEERDERARAEASAAGFRREQHCFSIF